MFFVGCYEVLKNLPIQLLCCFIGDPTLCAANTVVQGTSHIDRLLTSWMSHLKFLMI